MGETKCLLARFDAKAKQWRITGGTYKVALSKSAEVPVLKGEAQFAGALVRTLKK